MGKNTNLDPYEWMRKKYGAQSADPLDPYEWMDRNSGTIARQQQATKSALDRLKEQREKDRHQQEQKAYREYQQALIQQQFAPINPSGNAQAVDSDKDSGEQVPRLAYKNAGFQEPKLGKPVRSSMTPDEVFGSLYDTTTTRQESAPKASDGEHSKWFQRRLETYVQAQQEGRSQGELDNYLKTLVGAGDITQEEAEEIRGYRTQYEEVASYSPKELEDNEETQFLRNSLMSSGVLMGLNDSQREYLSGELGTQRQQLQEQRKALEETLREMEAVYDDDSELDWETPEAERVRKVRAELDRVNQELWQAKSNIGAIQMAQNLAQRQQAISAYEVYRENSDFSAVSKQARNAGYRRKEDPLGYYLNNREFLDSLADIDYSPDNGKNWGELEEPEIEMYYYLLGSQGKEAAGKYLEDIQIQLDQRDYVQTQALIAETYQNANIAGKIGMNAVSVPASVMGSITAPIMDAAGAVTGNYNPYNSGHDLTNYAQTVRGATAEDIQGTVDGTKQLEQQRSDLMKQLVNMYVSGRVTTLEQRSVLSQLAQIDDALDAASGGKNGIPWGKLAANTYQAVMSGADSALGATLFGKGYTVVMGTGAASQRAQELWEAGASDVQICIGAVASGLIEMATEKYSVEYFTENFLRGSIKGGKDWLAKTLIQGFNEMSEEVASELANMVADALILGANSDNQQEIRELMESEGLSYEEAKKQAILNRAVDIFWAAYGGFVSGGTMGGIGGGINYAQQNSQYRAYGKEVINNQAVPELLQRAQESGVSQELYQLAQEKAAQDLEKMNWRQQRQAQKAIGKLYAETVQAQKEGLQGTQREVFRQEAQDRLTGKTDDAQAAAEAVTKAAYGEELTRKEKRTVEEAGGDALISEIANSREFQEAAQARFTEKARTVADTMGMAEDLTKQRDFVERFAKNNGMDAEVMKNAISRGQNAIEFTNAWQNAYDMGAGGIALRYAQKAKATSYLTQQQIETAYNEGRKAGYYEETAGEGAVSDGVQWNDRADSGGQLREMEGFPGEEGQPGQAEAAAGAAGAAEGVTAIDHNARLGNRNGNVKWLAPEQYSEDARQAEQEAKKNGLRFAPFRGGALTTTEEVNGRKITVRSRGCVVDGTMYVRVDDNTFTARQIAGHEAAHERIRRGEINVAEAKQRLLKRYSKEEIDAIIELYSSAYGDCGMDGDDVLVEIICDAMAGMNAFATEETERVAGEVGLFLRNVRKAAKDTGATKNTTGEGGVTYYSREIEYDPETQPEKKVKGKYSREMDVVTEAERDSEGEKLSKNQIEYYRDSKARDENGNLMALYHGTPDGFIAEPYYGAEEKMDEDEYPFTTFQQGVDTGINNGIDSYQSRGIWLTSKKEVAYDYAQGNGVFRLYANIKNPLDARTDEGAKKIAELINEYYEENFGADVGVTESSVLEGIQEIAVKIEEYGFDFHDGINYIISQMQDGTIDYDGLIIDDKYRGDEGTSFVAIKPEQVKNANNQNPTENEDIRFSREMDTVKALERQNELLKERVGYWKEQAQTTKTVKADKAEVRSLAREILRGYSSKTRAEDIIPDLQRIANQNDSYSDMVDAAEGIARKILEGSGVDVNGNLAETRKELKQYLRSTPINITEIMKAGIPDFTDFKKRNRAMHFREDGSGTDMDSIWLELQDQFGTGMFPEDVANPEDQVRFLADKVAEISEDIRNPYGKDMEFTVQQATYDILYRASEVKQEKPTKADQAVEKATRELQQLLEAGRKRENKRISDAKSTELRKKIKAVSEKFQRMATRPGKGETQHAPEKLKKAVIQFCDIFTESEIRRADRWEKSLEKRADDLGRRMNIVVTKSFIDEYNTIERQQERQSRMKEKLLDLQSAYNAMKKDPAYQTTYDETVAEMLKNLSEALDGQDIYQMNIQELRQVQQTMSAIYYTVTNANKAFAMGKDKTIIGMATKMAGEIRQTNPRQAGLMVAGRRFLQWQMSPDTFFNYLCGFAKDNEGKVIQKGFQRGAERMLGVQRQFYEMFRDFTESKDKAVHKELKQLMNYSAKRMVNWGLKDMEGNEVVTTRGMMMQAYMMLCQKDSFESLQHGGFSIPNAERYYKGDVAGAYGDGLETTMLSESIGEGYTEMIQRNKDLRSRIEEVQQKIEISETERYKQMYQQEINELEKQIRGNRRKMGTIVNQAAERLYTIRDTIEKQLTPLEKKLIDRAHEWYSHSGKLMQDVFEQMYGFRANLVEDYVPIHRDPSTIKVDIRDMAGAEKAFNLENSGFTIERVKNSQPILLTDFFQELTNQKDKMARYVGFAQVQKDFGKVWKTRIDGSGMTVNTLVRARFGAGKTNLGVSGEEYINHYIADVAGGHKSDDILSAFYGNYAAATLRFNPRVAVSQAASIPTAAAVVGWKNMAAGFAKGLPKAMSTKYRNELASKNVWFYQRYRGEGGSTELADIRQRGGMIERVANSNVGKILFNWCQEMDVFSTGSIMWSAAESYVQQQGIRKGTEEFDAAVNEVYTDIIRKSQPNYTTTERSDMLRDQRAHMKLLTMFKTQSNQNFNLLLEANGEYIRMKQDLKNGRNGVTEADVKAAGKKLGNAATGVLLGGTVSFVALRTIMNFIMGAVDPYRDEETDEVTLEATLKGITKEILSSISGTVALGGQVYDIVMAVITGDRYYGLSDSAVSSMSSMLENTITVLQKGTEASGNQVWKMANSWCMVFGIPANNAKKLCNMIFMYAKDIENGTFGQYTSEDTTNVQLRSRLTKYVVAGDEKKADDALALLIERSTKDTDEETLKWIRDAVRQELHDAYDLADITDTEAIKVLKYVEEEDPDAVVAKWEFQLERPEVEKPSDKLVAAYNMRGSIDGGVLIEAYYYKNGHTKEETVAYIQALKISSADKKKLWDLIKGDWKDKGTPWE